MTEHKNEDQESAGDEAKQSLPEPEARIPEEVFQAEPSSVDISAVSGDGGSSTPGSVSATEAQKVRFSVFKKLVIGFGVVFILFLGLIFFIRRELLEIQANVAHLVETEAPLQEATLEMEINLGESARAILGYLRERNPQFKERAYDAQGDFEGYYKGFTLLAGAGEKQRLGEEVNKRYREFKSLGDEIMSLEDKQFADLTQFRRSIEAIDEFIDEKIQKAVDQGQSDAMQKMEASLDMEVNIKEAYAAVGGYLIEQDPALREEVRDAQADFEQFEAIYRQTNLSTQERSWIDQLDKDFAEAMRTGNEIMALEDKKHELLKQFESGLEKMDEILDEDVQGIIKASVQKLEKDTLELSTATIRMIVVAAVIMFMIGFIVAFLISRGLNNSIGAILLSVRRVAQANDLTGDIHVQSSDEMGILGGMFNNMRANLYSIVSQIQQAALKINSSSNEILATTNQQEASTKEQASQMNEIRSTLNESVATSTELSQTAEEVTNFAKDTGDDAQEGTRLIEDTNTKMTAMKDSNKTVSERLRILNEKIEGIGKILTTILSVADQTNLLSLNAAIEAAKAGEHGKGFSVVAQEIRRLADQTAQSSKEITSLINDIQTTSSGAIMVMDKSSQDVNSGTQLVNQLSGQFSKIAEKVQTILTQIESIAESINEQATGNREIASTVDQMAEATRMTATSAAQTRQLAYDMTALGQQLRTAVTQFKLK